MKLLPRFMRRSSPKPEPIGICVSFPKSGRTWLRVMLDELHIPIHYTHAGSSHKQACPLEQLPNPATRLGHNRIIFLHRDPRDVVVSNFFQATKRDRVYDGSLSAFLRDPRYGLRKIIVFNDRWLEAVRGRPDVCIVSYEGLHASAVDELRCIVSFFGQTRDAGMLEKAAQAGRFEIMKEKEVSGAYRNQYGSRLRPADPADADSYKVRRGTIGGFVDYFSAADLAYCDEVMERHTAQS